MLTPFYQSPLESDLIPYTAATTVPALAALVLAPHPDDEVFGCGGAIASHVRNGVPVQVIILTDGARFGEVSLRADESRAAANVLGYGEPQFWSLPDRGLGYSEELVQRIADHIARAGVDLVYAPSPWEIHPDHRQTTWLATEAVRRVSRPVRLAFFEVGAPLRPNVLLDITASLAIKEAAMRCFESQLVQQDYVRHIQALNQYRTYTLPRDVLAAEAFWVVRPNELDHAGVRNLFTAVSPGLFLESGHPKQSLPLVSILIRSMDREFLSEALDSVALQTYPNIEVLVLAAAPNHQPLSAKCGPFKLRLLETDIPLLRSRSANKAMESAQGSLLLFLDDDDWLMPGHVARLAQVFATQPHALTVYTGISLVDIEGKPMGQTFDLPYDAIRQMAGNLMPIHAVLFSAKVLELGCRFDESLDRYEDWDFWLQLSKLAPMVHLPGVSGAYRIHESSGAHSDAGPAGAAAGILYQKWETQWTARQIGQMMHRVWSHPELEANLSETRRHLSNVESELKQSHITRSQNEAALEQRETTMSERESSLAPRESALAQREYSLMQMESTRALRKTALTRQESAPKQDERVLAQQVTALAQQQQLIDSLSLKVAEAAETLAHREYDNRALLTSTSWRITRPFRWLAQSLRTSPAGWAARKIRAGFNGVDPNNNKENSLLNLYRKAFAYWRKYGSRTLIKRVRGEFMRKSTHTASPPQTAGLLQTAASFINSARPNQDVTQLIEARFEALKPLHVYPVPPSGHRRINIVTDSIGRGSLFGGVGTALIFATLLANKLGADLRIITRTERPQSDNVDHILSVYGLELEGEVQFKFVPPGDQKQSIEFSEDEVFITTSWWTTAATLGSVPAKSIIYLLQEDERMFYPFGDDRVRCEGILRNRDIRFLINTRLLFEHLVADGLSHIQQQGSWFEPAFPTRVFYPRHPQKDGKRKFMFYARPNNLRNLFYLGVEVIEAAIAQQILDPDAWDIIFVGKDIPDIVFGSGHTPTKHENLNWSDYAELVGTIDLGLSLMSTPHPSYPPLDLVASGAVVVTNRFGNKQDLTRYSENLICAELERDALVEALRRGVSLAMDRPVREKNYINNGLSAGWQDSFANVIQHMSGNA